MTAHFLCRVLLNFLVAYSLVSCAKTSTQELYVRQSLQAKEIVEKALRNGDTIMTVETNDGWSIFYFSDGTSFRLWQALIPIVQIGLNGNWYKNGVNSGYLCEETDGLDVLLKIDTSTIVSESDMKPSITCVVEGYRDWTFVFADGSLEKVMKYAHSFDFDSIVRGINHRGYSAVAPENTLPAYRASRLHGFTYVETDIHFTADGIPVCIHDSTVDRTSDGSGAVKDMTLAQLRGLDFGSWRSDFFAGTSIPTLEEFLALCRTIGLIPYIELKEGTKDQISAVVSLVNNYGFTENAVYISFTASLLKYVLTVNPSARVGYLTSVVNEDKINSAKWVRSFLSNPSTDTGGVSADLGQVFISSSDCSSMAASLCEEAGFPLEVWTIDSPSIIMSLPVYISGVTSNSLHAGMLLKQVMKR